MGHLNKNYDWPYNLAWDIFDGDTKRFKEILPEYLKEVVEETLSEREKKCIKLRYIECMTYDEIGKEFNLTRERIRQIIIKAIRRLRHPVRANKYLGVQKYKFEEVVQKNAKLKLYSYDLERMLAIPHSNASDSVPFFHTPIEKLGLTVRSFNCLVRGGIKTYGDLQNYRICDLTKLRNLGMKSFNEILDKLSYAGFKACYRDQFYELKDYKICDLNRFKTLEDDWVIRKGY